LYTFIDTFEYLLAHSNGVWGLNFIRYRKVAEVLLCHPAADEIELGLGRMNLTALSLISTTKDFGYVAFVTQLCVPTKFNLFTPIEYRQTEYYMPITSIVHCTEMEATKRGLPLIDLDR